jgi:hypothetical protein
MVRGQIVVNCMSNLWLKPRHVAGYVVSAGTHSSEAVPPLTISSSFGDEIDYCVAGAVISHGSVRVSRTLSRLSWKLMLPVSFAWCSQRKNQ